MDYNIRDVNAKSIVCANRPLTFKGLNPIGQDKRTQHINSTYLCHPVALSRHLATYYKVPGKHLNDQYATVFAIRCLPCLDFSSYSEVHNGNLINACKNIHYI